MKNTLNINMVSNNLPGFRITSNWLSGFTQADGSFVVSFTHMKKGFPIRPVPEFNLTQSNVDSNLFKEIQKHLGVGKLYENRGDIVFVVRSIEELVEVILPLFESHPPRGGKLESFKIFKEVVLMIQEKKHLTLEGILHIIELSYFMNDTSLRTEESKAKVLDALRQKFGSLPSVQQLNKSSKETKSSEQKLDLEFVRGLIDGDGSFFVAFKSQRRRIVPSFSVVAELSSKSILHEVEEYFGCGKVYNLPSKAARYQVDNLDDLLEKIYPKLKDIRFNTIKQGNFEKTMESAKLIKTQGYQTDETLKQIVDLAWDMNKDGGRRKLSKSEYLSKFISHQSDK